MAKKPNWREAAAARRLAEEAAQAAEDASAELVFECPRCGHLSYSEAEVSRHRAEDHHGG